MIKVVWICSVSNSQLRKNLDLYMPLWKKVIRRYRYKSMEVDVHDTAIWNTYALHEFEEIDGVNLHVIFVHPNMRSVEQRFIENGISYYAVNENDSSIWAKIRNHITGRFSQYHSTWRHISSLVREINPDIIHLMGAENPPYSLSILKLPTNIPIITQLQTLLHNPAVKRTSLKYQKECEYSVLNRTNYIGTKSDIFPRYIREYIKKDVVVVNTSLIIAEQPDMNKYTKRYDFVYWANMFSKGIDQAMEAFGIVHKKYPDITFDVIGGIFDDLPEIIKKRINELGIRKNITFEGRLPTHEDVLTQIKKARVALLPLRSDLVSSTVREAMWSGLPVITTITQGTPVLNRKRQTVLLSEIDNYDALANNMIKLIEDPYLVDQLRTNGFITVEEEYGGNRQRALEWVETYYACIANFKNATPIPNHVINSH